MARELLGQVVFAKNDAPSRVIMHVDVSIPLWAFFDLYGSTRKIQIVDPARITTSVIDTSARNHRASSEGVATTSLDDMSTLQRSARPASTAFNLDSLRVALPPVSSAMTPESYSSENLPTSARTVPTTTFTISPTSSTSSSAPLGGIDSLELARLRASIARRLSPYEIPVRASSANADVPSGATGANSTDTERSPFAEFLASRRARQTAASSSPSSLLGGSPRLTRNAFADIFESHLRNEDLTRPLASTALTAAHPATSPHLPSALRTSGALSTGVGRAGASSTETRRGTFTQQDSDHADEGVEGGDGQNYSECAICMSARVNAGREESLCGIILK